MSARRRVRRHNVPRTLLRTLLVSGLLLSGMLVGGLPARGDTPATGAGAATAAAPALATRTSYGQHGMVLFGGSEGLYAAHLPMFHAPHDYQVLLRVHVADPALDGALRQRLAGGAALWTIAPEDFELDRLAPQAASPLKQFKADLVRGHFEQNGKPQYRGATVLVDQVLAFRQLSAAPARNTSAHYLRIGNGRQRFLVKQIDSRPDFDHIVAYRAKDKAGARGATELTLAKPNLRAPDAAALAAALHVGAGKIVGTVYYSTEDLR